VTKLITTTLLLAGLALAEMAAPAAAQMPGPGEKGPGLNLMNEGSHRKTVEDWQDEQDREKAYKSGMKKIPDQKVKSDPWGAVRTTTPAASPPTASNQRPAAK
jgi:hypothetical protein